VNVQVGCPIFHIRFQKGLRVTFGDYKLNNIIKMISVAVSLVVWNRAAVNNGIGSLLN